MEYYPENFTEFETIIKPEGNSELLILAGDAGIFNSETFKLFMQYCSDRWTCVIYVLGNHEFYGSHKTHMGLLEIYKSYFDENYPNVVVLENEK